MGQYTLPDGRSISYTDSDTLRDVADLYAVIQGEYKGTPSAASEALKKMLGDLQAGKPLEDSEWDIYHRMKQRYASQLTTFRKSPENDEQGFVPLPPSGAGRVSEALSAAPPELLRRMQEQYATESTTTKDRHTTPPHLLDGALHDLAHAVQHGKRLSDGDVRGNDASMDFNVEHMMKHVVSGMDHLKRLGEHLEQHPSSPKVFKAERDTLNSMREAEDLIPPSIMAKMRESAPPPPRQLRKATGNDQCGNCDMFYLGRCWGYDGMSVQRYWVCNSWVADTGNMNAVAEAVAKRGLVEFADRLRPLREDAKPQVCIDFDGVIYDRSNEPGGNNLAGQLIKGAAEGLAELAKNFRIIVLTARPNPPAVRGYLVKKGLGAYISDVTNVKPSAAAYVDNRALLFRDSWPRLVQDLEKGQTSPYESDVPGGTT